MKPSFKITKIKARQILDSRGNPTVEVDVFTKTHFAREKVPSGASTGIHEALELRDGGKKFLGQGVMKAVNNVNKIISKKIIGLDCRKQCLIDQTMIELDGTENKTRLGANAILGVSLATARLSAQTQNKPLYSILGGKNILPVPCFNVINGGLHADNKLSIQEFMICPQGRTFADSFRMGSETYYILKKEIKKKFGGASTNVGDEGGFAPNICKAEDALNIITKAIRKAGYQKKIKIAIDAAASDFLIKKSKQKKQKGKYFINGKYLSPDKLMDLYESLFKKYPIFSLEDPFYEDDFDVFAEFLPRAKKHKVQIVGDDHLVTNVKRIRMALKKKSCNALLLKVNQIGTLTESIEAAKLAMKNKWNVMVSHRSGETTSSFIADLVVGLGTGQIKSGAPCRGERLAKYNQLLRIEEQLGKRAKYKKLSGF